MPLRGRIPLLNLPALWRSFPHSSKLAPTGSPDYRNLRTSRNDREEAAAAYAQRGEGPRCQLSLKTSSKTNSSRLPN